jgi:hypothetical protein
VELIFFCSLLGDQKFPTANYYYYSKNDDNNTPNSKEFDGGTWTTERVTEIQLPTVVTKSNPPHSEGEGEEERERSGPPVRLWRFNINLKGLMKHYVSRLHALRVST